MLILKKPLQCKTLSPLSMLSDMFEEKITGNYELLSANIRREELLHMVSVPPEIYIGQEGMSGILAENNIRNSHTVNVSVINNLLNRILLFDVKRFTYQDSVYVTAILNRLGIYDVKEFMKQVRKLRETTDSMETLTQLYENNSDRLKELFWLLERKQRKPDGKPSEAFGEKQPEYYLHQAVYTRLDTGNIYRTVAAYSGNQATEEYEITKNELLSAESLRVSREMIWNQMKNRVSGRNMPVFFCYLNRYEMENSELTEITEDTILSQLNAAVLLNLADNLYMLRSRQIHREPENSFLITNALYQSGESTVRRFEEYHKNQMIFRESAKQYLSDVNQAYQEEIALIKNICSIMPLEHIEQKNYGGTNTAEHWHTYSSYSLAEEQQKHENYENLLQLQYINEQDLKEWNEEEKAEYYQSIRQQLDRVNEQNLLMRDRVQKLEEKTPVYRKIAVDREKAKKDSLRALENPEEVLLEYLTDTTELERVESRTRDQLFGLFSDETKEIYEKLLYNREKAGQYAPMDGLPAEEQKHILQEMVLTEQSEKEKQEEQRQRILSDDGERKEQERYENPSIQNLYQMLQHIEQSMDTTSHASEYKTNLYQLSEEIWPEEKEALRSYLDTSGNERAKLSPETIERLERRLIQWEKGETRAAEKIKKLFSAETRAAYETILTYRKERQEQIRKKLSEKEKTFIREELVQAEKSEIQQSEDTEWFEKRVELIMKQPQLWKQAANYFYDNPVEHIQQEFVLTRLRQEEDWQEAGAGITQVMPGAASVKKQQIQKERAVSGVTEKWLEPEERTEIRYHQDVRKTWTGREMIYKNTETELDEELLQSLMTEQRMHQKTMDITENTVEESRVSQTQIKETTRQTVMQSTEDITELVNQGVRRQLGVISEQVFNRLEKKLASERKRRGF